MTFPNSNLSLTTDSPVIEFSHETRLLAHALEEKLRTFPSSDPRSAILSAICSSGLMLALAQLYEEQQPISWHSTESAQRFAYKKDECLLADMETLHFLIAAGITCDTTALEWLENIRESVDRDAAELEALEARQRVELNEFFQSKGA
jgi:hypothetical protein